MPLTFNFGEENRPELFEGKPKTPVTLISGFLGTGKTTLLKHLLENQDGVRIGVVVNDVAAVNIDSQLVRRYEKGLVEVAELQNGCVCCSSADDLFSAVQNIVMRSKEYVFEHIVVELSGVGEPEAVKKNWAIGLECTMPVALRTEVKRVITVVDASTFGQDWLDTRQAQERNEQVQGDRHDEKNKARLENVGQLLAEQVEWADVVLVNKIDMASPQELDTTIQVVSALNSRASMLQASHGKVAPRDALPEVPRGLKVVEGGEGEGFAWSQTSSSLTVRLFIEPSVKGRDIDFKVGPRTLRLGIRNRASPRLEGRLAGELRDVDEAMFEIEGSSASGEPRRCAVAALEKRRPGMWPALWDGSSATPSSAPPAASTSFCAGFGRGCGNPDCSHEGHQSRTKEMPNNRAQERFGIHSFTFQSRRPFSGARLEKLLKSWPTPRKQLFTLEELAASPVEQDAHSDMSVGETLRPVLRSKGFCWLDSEPLRQHLWAQAGKTLDVRPGDWWWAALDKEQLKFKVTYPGVEADYKMAKKEKWDKDVGDRRQELVFIGGPDMRERDIVPLLEACILTDIELKEYEDRTRQLKVPNDEFHVNGLLKNLGASEDQIAEINEKAEKSREEERSRRKQDREETDFLRSLGVGKDLETEDEEDVFEAID